MVKAQKPSANLRDPSDPELNALQRGWLEVVQAFSNLGAVPLIVLLMAAVGFLMLGSKQGADLAHSLLEDGRGWRAPWVKMAMLVLTSLLFGGGAWFWSRRMVEDACGPRETWRPKWLLEWFPRVLGALPFVFAAAAVLRSGEKLGPVAVLMFVLGVGFAGLLAARQSIEAYVDRRTAAFSQARREHLATIYIRANLALAAAMMLWFSLAPVRPAQFLGAIGVVYLGVGLIIPVLAWVIHKGQGWRLPVMGFLVAMAVFWSWAGEWVGDNHAVGRRAFGGGWDRGPQVSGRPNFPEAFDAWWSHAPGAPGQPKPMIVVAAAGGASRAGYWAASVLGDLQDGSGGRFAQSLFAISSVSGGSVGSAAFVSQLYDDPAAGGRFGDAVRKTAGGDFLSPALAGLLFPDLAQRFLPTIPLGRGMVLALPDRAEALEKAFEAGWTDHCRRSSCRRPRLWSEPLQNLWSDPSRHIPLMFINGERQEDGRRVITSRVIIDSAEFPDAVDFYAATQERDLAVSSAIHNGARFPVVSPGGVLLDQQGHPNGHVLDGGYFENSGLTTATDIVRAALSRAKATGQPIRPIVIELNNDSDISPTSPMFYRGGPVPDWPALVTSPTDYFLSDLLGPLAGLASSRDGRATPVAINLARDLGPDYLLIRLSNLCDGEKPSPRKAPMDWVLSRAAKATIYKADKCEASNSKALARVVAALPPVQK